MKNVTYLHLKKDCLGGNRFYNFVVLIKNRLHFVQIIINLIVNARDAINLKDSKKEKNKQIKIETNLIEIDQNYVI